jgi:hypothetical protein
MSEGHRSVSRDGKPPARMEWARCALGGREGPKKVSGFGGGGEEMSQCRCFRDGEARSGCIMSRPIGSAGQGC